MIRHNLMLRMIGRLTLPIVLLVAMPTRSTLHAQPATAQVKPAPDSMTAEALFLRGNQKYAKGDIQGAIADLTQAIKLKPNLPEPYNNRGAMLLKLGDTKAAISDYDQAIKLKPDYANAYFNRGSAREKLSNNQGALTDYNQAIQLNPNQFWTYHNRGNVRRALGDKKGAIADYQQTLKLMPPKNPLRPFVLETLKKLQR